MNKYFSPWVVAAKSYFIVAVICLVVGYLYGLYSAHKGAESLSLVKNIDTAEHDAPLAAPVKAKDKVVLKKSGVISKEVAQDPKKEVTAAAEIKDSAGTTFVSNVINIDNGHSDIVSQRPIAEWMNVNEIGIGATAGTMGIGEVVELQHTFARVKSLYLQVRLDAWRWEYGPRRDSGHNYDGQITTMLMVAFP